MKRFAYPLAILASSVLASACTDDLPPSDPLPPGSTQGGENNTFDHPGDSISPWELLDRLTKEGPPSFTSHMHSCPKDKYATLGNILTGVGINAANTTAVSAGDLYTNGMTALGAANYPTRIRENVAITSSGSSREFDFFAAGAPEVIAAFSTNTNTHNPKTKQFDAS